MSRVWTITRAQCMLPCFCFSRASPLVLLVCQQFLCCVSLSSVYHTVMIVGLASEASMSVVRLMAPVNISVRKVISIGEKNNNKNGRDNRPAAALSAPTTHVQSISRTKWTGKPYWAIEWHWYHLFWWLNLAPFRRNPSTRMCMCCACSGTAP